MLLFIILILPPILLGGLFYLVNKNKQSFIFPIISFYLIIFILCIITKFWNIDFYIENNLSNNINKEYNIIGIWWVWIIYLIVQSPYFLKIFNEKLINYKYISGFLKVFYSLFLVYFSIILFVFFSQESLLFFSPKTNNSNVDYLQKNYKDFKKLKVTTEDNTVLSWYFLPRYQSWSNKELKAIILYFWGNNEEVSNFLVDAYKYPDFSIISFNYRWFWDSSWDISTAMMWDINKIYDLASKYDTQIIIVWRSIWTAFASKLSSFHPNIKTVLITPFDSILSLAKKNYSFLPASYILRYRFDNETVLKNSQNNIWIFVAENDNIIPKYHWKNLFDNINSKTKVIFTIKKSGHNSILNNDDFWIKFNDFLKK